jgi:hypothetical protein
MPLPLRLSKPGPILEYIEWLSGADEPTAIETARAIKAMLKTPEGAILLDLLQKSLEMRVLPMGSVHSALAERNAQCFILSDLRRLLTDETDQILAKRTALASAGRTIGRHG